MEPSKTLVEEYDEIKTEMKNKQPAAGETNLVLKEERSLTDPEFVKYEMSLFKMGYFSVTSRNLKNVKKKVISYTRTVDGKELQGRLEIYPSAQYGAPSTSHQDKLLAIFSILEEIKREQGTIRNPVGVSSVDILDRLGLDKNSGKNYDDLYDFFDLLHFTGMKTHGAPFFIKKIGFDTMTATTTVARRTVTFKKELDGGARADRNYIWFEDWVLNLINNEELLAADFKAYKTLKNSIAKNLIPLLGEWLFASRSRGIFEKRYDELSQLLGITEYSFAKRIEQQLKQAFNELKVLGYISDWKIEKTADKKHFKIVLHHGEKYYRDRSLRGKQKEQIERRSTVSPEQGSAKQFTPKPPPQKIELSEQQKYFVELLVARGADRDVIENVIAELPINQSIQDQIEYIDFQVGASGTFTNSPGWYVKKLRENIQIPESFETSSRRKQREETEALERQRHYEETLLETEHIEYEENAIQEHKAQLQPTEYEKRKEIKRQEYLRTHPDTQFVFDSLLDNLVRADIKRELNLLTLDQFKEHRHKSEQGTTPQELPPEPVLTSNPPSTTASTPATNPEPISASAEALEPAQADTEYTPNPPPQTDLP
jgi:hypothetical protein